MIDDTIADDDFIVVIDSEGNLKDIILPEDEVDLPDTVVDILAMFNIHDIDQLNTEPTVH
jgi:hypothetical protein